MSMRNGAASIPAAVSACMDCLNSLILFWGFTLTSYSELLLYSCELVNPTKVNPKWYAFNLLMYRNVMLRPNLRYVHVSTCHSTIFPSNFRTY